MNTQDYLNSRKLVKEFNYEITPLDKGYTDKTVHINVTDKTVTIKSVPQLMKEKFIGGKGTV